MNIEMQVTNLSISKRLKDLNVKQESCFYWYKGYEDYLLHYIDYNHEEADRKIFIEYNSTCYSAYTASELIAMLPHMIDIKINEPFTNFRFWMTKSFVVEGHELAKRFIYIVNYVCDTVECVAFLPKQLTKNIHSENLANALALMLIYLIENKLMEIHK